MSQRKRHRPRSKRITLNDFAEWDSIVSSVDKETIPIDFLENIVINLLDGTQVLIEVESMIKSGVDSEKMQQDIEEKMQSLDAYIENVDMYVSVDEVAKIVGPITKKILKDYD